MSEYEIVELIVALAGLLCVSFGVVLLFGHLKASEKLDSTAHTKKRLTKGSAAMVMILSGSAILAALIIHKRESSHFTIRLPNGVTETIVLRRNFNSLPPEEIERLLQRIQNSTPVPNK